MLPIVLICGKAGSGKDTFAQMLVNNSDVQPERQGVSIAFADELKRLCKRMFPALTEEQLFGPSQLRNQIISESDWYRGYHGIETQIELFCESHNLNYQKALDLLNKVIYPGIHSGEITPRKILQLMGTEFGRGLDRDLWCRITIQNAIDILSGGYRYSKTDGMIVDPSEPCKGIVAISDGRFASEILSTKTWGCHTVLIERKQTDLSKAAAKAGVKGHVSEKELDTIPKHFYDFFVSNDSDLSSLQAKALRLNGHITMQPKEVY